MSLLATKLSRIKPSSTLAVTKKATELRQAGYDIISLGAGEPDFDTPDNIKEAAIEAIRKGQTKYTIVDGTLELKKAICNKFKRENNIDYNVDNISVGNGAKQVLYNALMATLDPEDEVIIPAPYWVSYPDIVELAGGGVVTVKGNIENDFKIDATILERVINNNTKWIILNSPSNPTGSAYAYAELKEITDLLLKYPKIYILSDDIYEHIIYDDFKFVTPVQVEPKLADRVLTVNGVSKSYSMTGWRIGYAGGPESLIKAMATIQSQSTSNPCSISQAAAIEALNGPQDFIKSNAALFQRRRDLAIDLINSIELLSCTRPIGAFYIFINCSKMFGKNTPDEKTLRNSNDVASYFLTEAKVAVVQGTAFGMDGFIRISYAISEATIEEAFKRIKEACDKLK
ncbi:MAG: pyridoxal phosphate-dependent aminotransferase [Alphaproteobacteria bacterium]